MKIHRYLFVTFFFIFIPFGWSCPEKPPEKCIQCCRDKNAAYVLSLDLAKTNKKLNCDLLIKEKNNITVDAYAEFKVKPASRVVMRLYCLKKFEQSTSDCIRKYCE